MAGIKDVIDALGGIVQSAVYPNGLMQPSIINSQVTIEGGWPIRTQLDKDIQAGNAHVSIFPTNQTKVVTKFERFYQDLTPIPPTITATVSGNTVTIGGTVSTPQAVMILVDDVGYGYALQDMDTLESIADSLANLIPGSTAITNVITIPPSTSLVARISSSCPAAEELSRQERVFLISCWCSGDNTTPNYDPTIRDVLADAIDIAMKLNYRIVLADDFYAQVFPMEAASPYVDDLEQSRILRRDLHYKIQYATTLTQNFMTITEAITNVTVVSKIN